MNDNNNPLNIFSAPVGNGRAVPIENNNKDVENPSNILPKEEPKKGVFFQNELPKESKIEETNIKRQFNPFGDGHTLQAQAIVNQPNTNQNLKQVDKVQNELPKTIDNIINNLNSDKTESFIMSDESLLRMFVGESYDKIENNNFNFSAFFFNAFYYAYRKMYLISMIMSIILLATIYVTKDYAIIFVVTLFTNIASGFIFNKSYLKGANNKVQKIKSNNQNGNLKDKCIKSGKPSVINVIILFIIFALVIYISLFRG